MSDLPFLTADPDPTRPERAPRKCRRHEWEWTEWAADQSRVLEMVEWCRRCHHLRDSTASRRNKNNRKRGTSDEPRVAALLGGRAIGPLNLPHDVEVGGYLHAQAKKLDKWPSLNEIIGWIDAIAPGPWMRAVTLADTPGAGRKVRRYIVIPLDEFASFHGARA